MQIIILIVILTMDRLQVIVVGDAGVGKTSLIHQLTRKKFSQQVMNDAFCKRLPISHWSRAGLHWDHLVVRLFVRDHAENGPTHRKMVFDCPLVITSKVKLFFRPDKTRKKE